MELIVQPSEAPQGKGGQLIMLLVTAGLLWPVSAFSGDFYSGNDLSAKCTAPEGSLDRVYCLGIMAGLADAFETDGTTCLPKNSSVGQVNDVVTDYLRSHPADRHRAAAVLGRLALREAFPCK